MTYGPSPYTGRSIRYRPRPSSALQVGATLANAPIGTSRYQGTAPGALFRGLNTMVDPFLPESQQQLDWGSPPAQAPSYAWRTPSPHTGRSMVHPGQDNLPPRSTPDYQSAIDSAYAGWEAAMGDANAQMEYLRASREIQLQEQALRRALLDGDLAKARQLLEDIEANKAALASAYDKYENTINPYFDAAVESGEEAGAAAQAKIGENTANQEAAQAAIAEGAAADTQAFGEKIGNTAAGIEAAQGLAGVGLSEYAKLQGTLAAGALNVSIAQQKAATLGPEGDRAWTIHQAAAREKVAMSDFDQRADAAADAITDLEMQRKLFDLQVRQSDLDHARAMEQALGQAPHMDAIAFGRESAAEYLYARAEALGLDPTRTEALLKIWSEAYASGVYDRNSWNTWSTPTYDPKTGEIVESPWGGPFKPTPDELRIVGEMFDAYNRGSKAWQDGTARPRPTTSTSAYTGGHSSSGTPSNNREVGGSARSPESGQFYARQQWVGSMVRVWEQMFNVRSAGQWRETGGACGGNTGRSCNSDHYTGGALDFKGSRSAMLEAYNYFRNHPAVAYVLFENNAAHMDHVHVSFKINYNY